MERTELAKCIQIAKQRFGDMYYPELAKGWAEMEFTDVRDYLNSPPETIKLRGMEARYIKSRMAQIRENEKQKNFEQYGLLMTDAELQENRQVYEDAQRKANDRVFGIACTDEELMTTFWTEVKQQIEEDKT